MSEQKTEQKPINASNIELLLQTDAELFFKEFNSQGSKSIAVFEKWRDTIELNDQTMRDYLIDCMQKQAPASFEGYNKYLKETSENALKMSTAGKAAAAATKVLSSFGTDLAKLLLSSALSYVVKCIDDYIHRADRASEATINAISAVSEISSQISSLGAEIGNLNSQIDSMNPLTDAEDIARLKEESKELQTQLEILKESEALASQNADEAAKTSLGMKQESRYDLKESQTTNLLTGETLSYLTAAPVTRMDELQNAMEAFDEFAAKKADLEAELAAMSETDSGYANKEKEIKRLTEQMQAAREHANELAMEIDKENDGLNGLDAESRTLLDSSNALLERYANWTNSAKETTGALAEQSNVLQSTAENAGKLSETLSVSNSEMVDVLNSMSGGFETLSSIYSDIEDKGTFNFTNLDSSKFAEHFEGLKEEYTDFINVIAANPDDIEACQDAFNNLTAAFIRQKGILKGLTAENAQLVTSMLESMGVSNAEEIVASKLSGQTEALALHKQFATEKGHELTDATYAEAAEFIQEANASTFASQELAQLALEKINVNNQQISTSSDIDNVIALANAAGASALAIAKLNEAKKILASESDGSIGWLKQYEEAERIIQSIKDGTFDFGFESYNPEDFIPASSGGTSKSDSYSSGSSGSSYSAVDDALQAAKDDFSETVDYYETKIQTLENSFSNLEKSIANAIGATAKNQLVDEQLKIIEKQIETYTEALDTYKKKASSSSELSEEWAGKISECTGRLEELQTQLRQLELAKFNNIAEDYTRQFETYENSIELNEKGISLKEESGEPLKDSDYKNQAELTRKQLDVLTKQKQAMTKQLELALASGNIKQGTDEWLEMVNAIAEVDGKILDCKISIEKYNNEVQNLKWEKFQRIQKELDNIDEEMSHLITLFDDFNDRNVSDGNGNWTSQALATLGLYAQQYELATYRAGQYAKQIRQLEIDYQQGKYSAEEYMDKLAELTQEQWDAMESANSYEDAIIELNKTRINESIESIEKEIDAYKELTDAQIKAIEETEELRKKQEDLADKSKNVADIEKQLAAMQNDNTAAAVARRKLLEEKLADAKKELADAEHEYSIEEQKEALQKQYEDYADNKNTEIEQLRSLLEDPDALLKQSFDAVKENASVIGQEISKIASEHGITVSNALTDAWNQGKSAIEDYGTALSESTSAFIENIHKTQNEIRKLLGSPLELFSKLTPLNSSGISWNAAASISAGLPELSTGSSGVSLHIDTLAEFNGDFNNIDHIENRMMQVASKTTERILDSINTDYKIRH